MDLTKKTIFILTGASKGIGKTMAVECCRLFKPNSLAILCARSAEGLEQTRKEILKVNKDIIVKVYSIDLGEATYKEYHQLLEEALTGVQISDFDRAFIVHNVGAVGDVKKSAKELSDVKEWQKYYHLNVFGLCALNSEFMTRFKNIQKLVVNITSGAGIKAFPSMALYCSGKACRQMFFQVLAAEETDTIVLNYSPGPVDTDLFNNYEKETTNEEMKKYFKDLIEKKTVLTTEQTTAKFIKVLKEFKFKSGDYVSYFE